MSKLYFRYGCMNCGKTTALLQVAHNYEERGMKVLLIKPSKDTKADKKVSARIGIEREVDILANKEDNLYKIINEYKNKVSCVIVDEAQFLEPIQVEELEQVTIDFDLPVIAYGLRTDFKGNAFPASIKFFEKASVFEEMVTICRCGKKAKYNERLIDGVPTRDGEQVQIDGKVKNITYEARCPECYYNDFIEVKESITKNAVKTLKKIRYD